MIKVCKKKNKSENKLLFEQVAVDTWDKYGASILNKLRFGH